LQGIPEGGRRKGKPRKRWLDDVEDDLGKTGVKRRIKARTGQNGEKYEAAMVLHEL
jgi:hypothetical protein